MCFQIYWSPICANKLSVFVKIQIIHFIVTDGVRLLQFSLYAQLCICWKKFFLSWKNDFTSYSYVFTLGFFELLTSVISMSVTCYSIYCQGKFLCGPKFHSIPVSCLFCFSLKLQSNRYLISPLSVCHFQLFLLAANSLYWFRKRKITPIASTALLWIIANPYRK